MEFLFAQVVAESISDDGIPDAPSILRTCDANAGVILDLPMSVGFLAEILKASRNRSNVELDQKRQAKRLFRLLVVGEGRIYYALRRYWLYRRSLERLSMRIPGILRPVMFVLDPPLIIIGVLGVVIVDVSDDSLEYLLGFAFGGLLLGGLAGYFSGRFSRVKSTSRLGSLEVWNALCVGLEFDRAMLWRMSGVGWWPGVRAQPV